MRLRAVAIKERNEIKEHSTHKLRLYKPLKEHFTQTATQDGGNNGGLTVENIANKLAVSKHTIERDLSTL